ncbi:MAG TPA: response regulator [Chryseosolibacter sp.]
MKVFYLDDDREELELFRETVEEVDPSIDCFVYSDSKLALRELNSGPSFDLIFLDYNMPIMSGEDCLRVMRQMPHLKSTPIVIYSTGVDEKLKKRLLACGATMVIKKHHTSAELKKFFITSFLAPQPKD